MIKKVLFFLIFFNSFNLCSQERDINVEKLSYYYNNNLIGIDLYNNILRSLDTNNIGPHTIIYNIDSVVSQVENPAGC